MSKIIYGHQVVGPVSSAMTIFGGVSGGGNYLTSDGSTQLTGDWNFGSYTISGTGDTYCNTLYTSSGINFNTPSGIIGVNSMSNLLELDQDKLRINGDFYFDDNSIIGTTGNITTGGDVTGGNIQASTAYKSSDGSNGATGWFDDGANFRVTVKNGIITNIAASVAGGFSMS